MCSRQETKIGVQSSQQNLCADAHEKMPRRTKTMGKDALVSCPTRYLHPSALIRRVYTNLEKGHVLQDLVVRRQEVKTINWKQHLALVVTHPMVLENDEPVELYAVKKHFKVLTEGPSDLFFNAEPEEKKQDEEEAPAIPLEVFEITGWPAHDEHDIAIVLGHLQVDDDNVLAPKNVPAGGEQVSDIFATSWSHNGMCYRNMMNVQNVNPWDVFPHDVKLTLVQLFSVLFPKGYIESII